MAEQADIGLIGLAVMGQNLVLNMDDHGFTVAVCNRTTSKVDRFMENEARGTNVIGTHSFLIEITADILGYKDEEGQPMVDKILDAAGQKGTGKWTAVSALELGIPLTLSGEAVFARFLSALKEERVRAAALLGSPVPVYDGDKSALIADLEDALYASRIVSYTQGYMLMRAASEEFGWHLAYGNIALMWRGGLHHPRRFLG